MRKSRTATARTRQAIVHAAGERLRQTGINGTAISDVTAAAGVTNGGFYRHFDSKDALVAEACAQAFEMMLEGLKRRSAGKSQAAARELWINGYLSTRHRDDPSTGCPLAALGSELRLADEAVRAAVASGYTQLLAVIRDQQESSSKHDADTNAIGTISALVGGLTLSRIVEDPQMSKAILEHTRKFVLTR